MADDGTPVDEGVPPLAAVLLIGNLFLLAGAVLVDVTALRIGLLLAAAVVLGAGVALLVRHAGAQRAVADDEVDGGDG